MITYVKVKYITKTAKGEVGEVEVFITTQEVLYCHLKVDFGKLRFILIPKATIKVTKQGITANELIKKTMES